MPRIIFFYLFLFLCLTTNRNTALNTQNGEDEFLVTVQKMPILSGGYELLQKKLKYPENARNNSIEGKVYILAYISETGECKEAKIVKGIGYGCDEESIRVVKSSRFIPGENNGARVKSKLTLAIRFALNY